MKGLKYKFKKAMAFFLFLVMVAGFVPAMSGRAIEVQAANENSTDTTPSVTAYATKAQLVDGTFAPNSVSGAEDYGKANNYGKIVFGKNESGDPQEWYILGRDSQITGSEGAPIDNIIIFAASPIATNQKFDDSDNTDEKKVYNEGDGTYPPGTPKIESVYRNHYGASKLRKTLQDMVKVGDTTYFTETEKELMNSTTVTTRDEKKNNNLALYTTTDKLYALAKGDDSNKKIIKAGTGDQTALNLDCYWEESSGKQDFWLRTGSGFQKLASCTYWTIYNGPICNDENVTKPYDVRPASNLNLSSALFASGAKVASSEIVSGTIESGTAMTLRLNGAEKAIGTVIYDTDPTEGKIAACKDEGATGTVSLVVQGKSENKDWYYSVPVEGTVVVTAEQISRKFDLNNLDLADCKIWLETTIDNVTYARTAEQKQFSVQYVDSVVVTDMNAPMGGYAFDTEASCNTTGIATTTPAIIYSTTGEDGEVTGNADWNTIYKAAVTLAAYMEDNNEGIVVYAFDDSVSATVDGVTLTDKFTTDPDGTLTVTKEFVTAKRKAVSVTVPTAPKIFTTYYGYAGYANVLSNGGNRELGTQVKVTLEGTENVASITEDMNVTWMIANTNDAPYDKTPGATNTFRWTIPASALSDYDAVGCANYDSGTGTITSTVTIQNKTATPVTITGTDKSITYTGAIIDVTQYFTIGSNAGAATYSLITGTDGGTGVGTLANSMLTVTKTGTFKIKVKTAANGIYANGEKSIILTVLPAKKGEVVKDDKSTGVYKVKDATKKEVAYQVPAKKNLTSVSIPITVALGGKTYKVTSIADNAFANNKKMTKVTIGSNVKTIGKKAFYNCTKLKTIKIGKNVTTIGSNAFYGCSRLTGVTIGSNVTTISDKAFYKCTSLTGITIPSKVKKIGKQAFYGCKKLRSITIKTTKLTNKNVGSSAFKGIYSKATIKVPKRKLTAYKKLFKSKGLSSKGKVKGY